MSAPMGLRNFSKLGDRDKAYLVKLSAILIASIVAGIISGVTWGENSSGSLGSESARRLGWLLYWGTNFGLSAYVKLKYDLSNMTNVQIFRHGFFVGFLTYIFIWTVVFNFIIFSTTDL